MIITLHLQVEDLGLASGASGDEELVEQVQDGRANVLELLLNLRSSAFN